MSPINVLRLYVCLNGSINSRHSPRCLRNSYISLVTLPLLAYRNDEWPSYWCWVISGNCFRTRIQRTLSFWILSSANCFKFFLDFRLLKGNHPISWPSRSTDEMTWKQKFEELHEMKVRNKHSPNMHKLKNNVREAFVTVNKKFTKHLCRTEISITFHCTRISTILRTFDLPIIGFFRYFSFFVRYC